MTWNCCNFDKHDKLTQCCRAFTLAYEIKDAKFRSKLQILQKTIYFSDCIAATKLQIGLVSNCVVIINFWC